MTYTKTDLAAQVLKHRNTDLMTPRQRVALILFDGQRSVDEVLRQTSSLGVQADDIARLVQNGLLSEKADAPAASASATPPASAPRPAALPRDEAQRRYSLAYPLATQLTAALGLRGFQLNLAVERADGYAGLMALLPKIEAAVSPGKARALRAALVGAAPG